MPDCDFDKTENQTPERQIYAKGVSATKMHNVIDAIMSAHVGGAIKVDDEVS